ncbi:MAG: DNA-3-methyladenine glycosylase I [Anaerolineales bacterium]
MPHGSMQQPGKPATDAAYLEEMTKAVFRAGFSWQVVDDKWPNFVAAFDRFDVEQVAAYDERDVDRLLADEGIVRNGRKIEATIHNARAMHEVTQEFGSFQKYLRSMDEQGYEATAKDMKARFSYLGKTGTFTFLWGVGEEVPDWEDR